MAGKSIVWRRRLLGAIAWGMVVSTGAVTATPSWATGAVPAAVTQKVEGHEALWSRLAGRPGEGVPVIVRFAMPPVPDAASFASPQAADEAQTSAIRAMQQKVLGAVLPAGALSSPPASEGKNIKLMDFSPMFAITATAEELASLAADPNVTAIVEDRPQPPLLRDSLSLIQMPQMYAAGATGNGYHVAVLDTGGRRGHVFLSSRITSEACYSTTNNAEGSVSLCPGGVSSSTATGSGEDCTASNVSGCGHGTHVAGTVAGWNTSPQSGQPTSGVARDARLISINVFSRFPASTCGLPTACVMTYPSDQIKGMERVYSLRNTLRIAAVNMSLGGGEITANCDSDPRKPIIDQLKAVRIATVIAAGNDGFDSAVAAPGCISSAVTVGSSTKWDGRSSFSNWGNLIDVVAPGSDIYSSYINGSSNNYFDYSSGTSMASPHVAGAFATLRQAFPNATVDQIENALKSTGTGISSAGVTKPRINVNSARIVLGGGTPPPPPGAPANDNFVNRTTIAPAAAGSTRTVTGTNLRATAEAGEPIHAGSHGARNSVWWRFTPGSSGTITIDTIGSLDPEGRPLDTVLGIYRGSSVASLVEVTSNDDADHWTIQSRVTFTGTAGVEYQIAVAGWAAAEGSISLNVQGGSAASVPPPNDNFSSRIMIPPHGAINGPRSVTANNTYATAQPGEPHHASRPVATNSVWWRYTPATSGPITIDTRGSNFNTVLAVYTGGTVSTLRQVAANDDDPDLGRRSRVTFNGIAGTQYQIAVAGGYGNNYGHIRMTVRGGGRYDTTPRPANDAFSARVMIPPHGAINGPRSVTGNNTNATAQPGEPHHASRPVATNSVWWRYTPATSGAITIDTRGSNFNTVLAVYTGSTVNGLRVVASNDDASDLGRRSRVTFNGTAGTQYQIAVAGGYGHNAGHIRMTVRGGGRYAVSSTADQLAAAGVATPSRVASEGGISADTAASSVEIAAGSAGESRSSIAGDQQITEGTPVAIKSNDLPNVSPDGSARGNRNAQPVGTDERVNFVSTVVTPSNDGILRIPLSGSSAAMLAVANQGGRADVVATVESNGSIPFDLMICRTDSATGRCIGESGSTITFTTEPGEVTTLAAQVESRGNPVPLDLDATRLVVNFRQNGVGVGMESIPLCTVNATGCEAAAKREQTAELRLSR